MTETNQEEFVSIMASHNVGTVELGLTTFEQVANFGSFKFNIEAARKSYAETLSNHMQNVSR